MSLSWDKAKGGSDEWQTKPNAVKPILEFIPTGSTVWCPFDTTDSAFYKLLIEHGCYVVATHINRGEDFFTTYRACDYIVSNPPFSKKTDVLKRLYAIGKPFAMLIGIDGVFENRERVALYEQYGVQMLYLNPRVSYIDPFGKKGGSPPFQSGYICWKVLPNDIVFRTIEKEPEEQITGQLSMLNDVGEQLSLEDLIHGTNVAI